MTNKQQAKLWIERNKNRFKSGIFTISHAMYIFNISWDEGYELLNNKSVFTGHPIREREILPIPNNISL